MADSRVEGLAAEADSARGDSAGRLWTRLRGRGRRAAEDAASELDRIRWARRAPVGRNKLLPLKPDGCATIIRIRYEGYEPMQIRAKRKY